MSLAQPPVPERRVSPTLELATNNPFRQRLSVGPTSPASATERYSFAAQPHERPKSRNPFLDVFGDDDSNDYNEPHRHTTQRANSFDASAATHRSGLSGSAAELFENLTLIDIDSPTTMNRAPPAPAPFGSRSRPPPPPGHHKSRSGQNEAPLISINSIPAESPRAPPAGTRRPAPPPYSRSTGGERSRDQARRPRRNSDSSVVEMHETEAKDRDRRERRAREAARKLKPPSGASKSRRDGSSDRRKKTSALDVIDKLDVTGIYGGGLFHHDGPFDACNPHRNKSSRRLAPVQAFPLDSANNSMSGFGPLNEKADHSHIFGNRDAEAFNDFTGARPGNSKAIAFDPKSAVETVHGFETLGLGTSTFLDGAPASKTAIQKTVQEAMLEERPRSSSEAGIGGGLARKKSLAQKIRSIRPDAASGRRRAPPPPGGNRSPTEGRSPTTPSDSKDDGAYINNNDYDDAYDRKGETITVEKRERAPSSPKKPHPGVSRIEESNNGGGLMKRVRSLSKPKRRNE